MPLKNIWGIPIFQARWSTRIWPKNLHAGNAGLLTSSWAIFKIEFCLLSQRSSVIGCRTMSDLWVVNSIRLSTRFANAVLQRWNTAVYIYARIADKNILPGTVAAIVTVRNAAATKSLNGWKNVKMKCCRSIITWSPLPCHTSLIINVKSIPKRCSTPFLRALLKP